MTTKVNKLYVLIDDKDDIAVKITDNKLGVFVRKDLAEKNKHLYNAERIVEIEINY